MKTLLLAVLVVAAACGAPAGATPPPAGQPSTPAVLTPTTAAEMASLWCPAAYLAECRAGIEGVFGLSLPAAVCVFPADKWSIVTPAKGDTPGSVCGTDRTGTIRGIIVAP